MRLTRDHIDFWRYKKSPVPAWFVMVRSYDTVRKPDIHSLIQGHAGLKWDDKAHNTLVILRSARKHGFIALMRSLEEMAENPQTLINPARRAAYCRKWLAKIRRKTWVSPKCGG